MKINELAKQSGVALETIRYYEKVGLLAEPERLANGYRQYPTQAVADLQFIKQCRSLGFSIEHIKQLQILKQGKNNCAETDRFVTEQLVQVKQKIAELQAIQQFLEQMLCCNSHTQEQCCIFDHLEQREH